MEEERGGVGSDFLAVQYCIVLLGIPDQLLFAIVKIQDRMAAETESGQLLLFVFTYQTNGKDRNILEYCTSKTELD